MIRIPRATELRFQDITFQTTLLHPSYNDREINTVSFEDIRKKEFWTRSQGLWMLHDRNRLPFLADKQIIPLLRGFLAIVP